MLRWLKALPLTMAITALIVFATFAASCGSSNSQARFVNAISDDAQSLDIQFNGTKMFGGVGPFSASGSTYVSIPTGSDKIEGFAAGTTTAAFSPITSPVSFNSGSQYTVVATGFLANGGSVTITAPVDTNKAPANGTVNFRVINASPSQPGAVDVYIIQNSALGTPSCTFGTNCPPPTISGISSPQSSITPFSGYVPVPFNSLGSFGYTLFVTQTGSTIPLPGWNGGFPIPEIGSVSAGSIRTIVLVDNAGGNTGMSSTPILLSDLN
jgi:Domain of unknown function (DUF4397)